MLHHKTVEDSAPLAYRRKGPLARLSNCWQLHLLALIPMSLIVLFAYVPMYGVTLAFKDFISTKGIIGSPFVGFNNFEYLFKLSGFWQAFFNTFRIAMLKIIVGYPIPIIVALMLNEVMKPKFKKAVQTIIYLPYFLSWAVLGGIFLDLFSLNGGVNSILNALGGDAVYWLGEDGSFQSMLITTDVWKSFGFNTIVYLATLTAIDPCLYESAQIDGANRWKQTWHITLPGIAPIAILLGVLNLGNVLNAGFDQIFVLINPLVRGRAEIIDTLVYEITFTQHNYGVATAVGLFRSVVSMLFIFSGWGLAHRFSDYKIF